MNTDASQLLPRFEDRSSEFEKFQNGINSGSVPSIDWPFHVSAIRPVGRRHREGEAYDYVRSVHWFRATLTFEDSAP